MPKLAMPGALIVGDAGGMVNLAALKGVHYAIKSGILAAEQIYARSRRGCSDFSAYERGGRGVDRSARTSTSTRNTRQPFQKGLFKGGPLVNLMIATKGRFPGGRWTIHRNDDEADVHRQDAKSYPKPDGKYTFDKLSGVFITGNATRDDAPNHIRVQRRVPREMAETWRWMCPAGVYEIPEDAPRGGRGRRGRQLHQLRAVRRDHRQGRAPDPARGRRRAALPRHLTRAPGSPAAGPAARAGASWRGKRTVKRAPPRARTPTSPRRRGARLLGDEREAEPRARRGPRRRAARTARRSARARPAGTPGPSSSTSERRRSRPGALERDARPGRRAAVAGGVLDAGCRRASAAPAPSRARRPASSGSARDGARRAGAARRGDARLDELGEVDVGVLGRRGVAARERLQAVEQVDEPALLGQRVVDACSRALGAGMSGWRASADSVAWTLVSGVRSSCPASAAKRRVGRQRALAVGRPSGPGGASIALKLVGQRAQLGRAVVGRARGGRGPRRRRCSPSPRRSRRSGRSTRSAASQTPSAGDEQREQRRAPSSRRSQRRPGAPRGRERGRDLQPREAAEVLRRAASSCRTR